jgi:hypothetical protein
VCTIRADHLRTQAGSGPVRDVRVGDDHITDEEPAASTLSVGLPCSVCKCCVSDQVDDMRGTATLRSLEARAHLETAGSQPN